MIKEFASATILHSLPISLLLHKSETIKKPFLIKTTMRRGRSKTEREKGRKRDRKSAKGNAYIYTLYGAMRTFFKVLF